MFSKEGIKELRIKWGFCPECGLVPGHPLNAYYHRDGKCAIKKEMPMEKETD